MQPEHNLFSHFFRHSGIRAKHPADNVNPKNPTPGLWFFESNSIFLGSRNESGTVLARFRIEEGKSQKHIDMAGTAKKITDLTGATPLLELTRLGTKHSAKGRIVAKLEYLNPGGSVKDRIAKAMVADAEQRGTLRPGGMIVEPTSGNTGIGLALAAAVGGYKLILTMPETMSVERRNLLAALGAEVVLTPGTEGMNGAIAKARELREAIPGAVTLDQFTNPANPSVHYATTGPEIWEGTEGDVDIFVAGVGTGGTVSGAGRRLREFKPGVRIVAVEPAESPVLSGGKPGPHKIQGIGAGFIPANYDPSVVDAVMTVSADEAIRTSRELARTEGLPAGISSGAAAAVALQIARQPDSEGKTIVVLLPDGGERYLSTVLYDEKNYPL